MNQTILTNGLFHQAFTHSSDIPETDLSETIQNLFPFSNFSIAAFSLSGKYETDAFQRQLVSTVPKYAADHAAFPIWSYRTENNENLLVLNHTSDFSINDYIADIHTYFLTRYNCPTFGESADHA